MNKSGQKFNMKKDGIIDTKSSDTFFKSGERPQYKNWSKNRKNSNFKKQVFQFIWLKCWIDSKSIKTSENYCYLKELLLLSCLFFIITNL